jgi:hypothetical protein
MIEAFASVVERPTSKDPFAKYLGSFHIIPRGFLAARPFISTQETAVRCSHVRDKLSAWIDGELAPSVARAVQSHLRTCNNCRRAGVCLCKLATVIGTINAPPAPNNLTATILSRVAAPVTAGRIRATPVRRLARWRRVFVNMRVAATVALVVGVSTGALVGQVVAPRIADPPAVESRHPQELAAGDGLDYFDSSQGASLASSYLALVSTEISTGE